MNIDLLSFLIGWASGWIMFMIILATERIRRNKE